MHVLQVAEESHGQDPMPTIQCAVLQAQPNVVYVPSTAPPALLASLTADDLDGNLPTIRKERAGTFTPERALPTLYNARIRGLTDDPTLPNRERLLRISACINVANTAQVCAAGALLSILRSGPVLSTNDVLSALREARLHGQLHLDTATLHGLQVCNTLLLLFRAQHNHAHPPTHYRFLLQKHIPVPWASAPPRRASVCLVCSTRASHPWGAECSELGLCVSQPTCR